MRERLRAAAGQVWGHRRDILSGIERFPAAVAALALFACAVNLVIAEAITMKEGDLARLGAGTTAAAAIAAAVILFAEAKGGRSAVAHLVSLAAALIVGTGIWFWTAFGVAPPAIVVGCLLCVPLAPYLRQRDGFWQFVWILAHATALAFITVAVFCAGVSAIMASLDYLFGVEIANSTYGHVWSTGLGFVGPVFVLSQIPLAFPRADSADPDDFVVSGIRILSDFVAVPLLAVYAAILHAYALKILVTAELPRGQIGWMVLSFGLAVLLLRIVVDPFGPFSRISTRLFLRWWAPALFVPLILLFIAVWERVSAYGLTPERYALALFGFFLLDILALQLVPRCRNDMRLIPAVGAVLLLLTGFGPWGMVSAPASKQSVILLAILAEAGAVENGRLTAEPTLSEPRARQAASIVRMLDEIGQLERLRIFWEGEPDSPFAAAEKDRVRAIVKRLGAEIVPRTIAHNGQFMVGGGGERTIDIGAYDIAVTSLNLKPGRPAVTVDEDGVALTVRPEPTGLVIQSGERSVTIPAARIRPLLEAVGETNPARGMAYLPVLDLTIDGARIGIVFERLNGRLSGDGVSIEGGSAILFLRSEDWR